MKRTMRKKKHSSYILFSIIECALLLLLGYIIYSTRIADINSFCQRSIYVDDIEYCDSLALNKPDYLKIYSDDSIYYAHELRRSIFYQSNYPLREIENSILQREVDITYMKIFPLGNYVVDIRTDESV